MSVIYVVGYVIFLLFNIFGFYKIAGPKFIVILDVLSFVFLGISIFLFEVSYKKDDSQICLSGIETLVMGIFNLALPYIYQIYNHNFIKIIVSALIIIVGYYIIKLGVVFYKKQTKYLRLQESIVNEETDNEFNIDDDDDE